MQKIVIISENYRDFYTELSGVEVIFADCYAEHEGALYVTDMPEMAKILDSEGVAWIWCGEFMPMARYCVENLCDVDDWYLLQVYERMTNGQWAVYEDDSYIVREMKIDDLPAMYKMYEKPGVLEHVEPLYEYEEELLFTKSYIEHMYVFYGYGLWLAIEKSTGNLVGRLGFSHRNIDGAEKVELGYIIDADYQRKGIAYELCSKLIEIGKKYWGFEEIFVCCEDKNARSIALAQKLGFDYYGACDNQVLYRLVSG